MRNTVLDFIGMKRQGRRIAMLTCYDYTMARLLDASGIDAILVGDSLGCVMLGYPDTLPVTMDDMIHHARAVVRGCQQALVVVDMPFMSYQASIAEAVRNAGRLIKETGAQAVKLEGGASVIGQIRAIVDAGIPVQAHVGMTPQSVNALGGFKVQGRGEEAAARLLADARAVEQAGAFSVVLECVPPKLAALASRCISRRSALAQVRAVTDRCLSARTCSGCLRTLRPALSNALPKRAKPCARRSAPMPKKSGPEPSPPRPTPLPVRTATMPYWPDWSVPCTKSRPLKTTACRLFRCDRLPVRRGLPFPPRQQSRSEMPAGYKAVRGLPQRAERTDSPAVLQKTVRQSRKPSACTPEVLRSGRTASRHGRSENQNT